MSYHIWSNISGCVSYEDFVKNIPLSGHGVALARKKLLADQDFCDCAAAYASPAAEDGETALTLLERATTRYKFRAWLVALKNMDWEESTQEFEVCANLDKVLWAVTEANGLYVWPEEPLVSRKTGQRHYDIIFDGPTAPDDEPFVNFSFGGTFRRVLTREGREMQTLLGIPLGTYHHADSG